MGAVGSGASNIGGRRDSQSITWEHSGGDGDLGAAVGLGSGVKRWATAEREQVESGARRARSVGLTDAQIEIRSWVQRRRRLGSGDDGEGVTKAPQRKKGCRRQRKSRAGRARTGQITVQSRASRESRSSEKPKIDVERGRAKSANRHGQRTVSTRSMRKEVQDQGERKMSRAA